jgi:hypothetical protein
MSTPVWSVDELCVAAGSILTDHLAETMVALFGGAAASYKIKTLQQVPTPQALVSADLPALAITSSGLTRPPKLERSAGLYRVTWGVGVGVYERGRDHDETQAKVRNWIAGVRTTLLTRKSLGGLASDLGWSGEQYALVPNRESARTLAGGAVAFNVTAAVPLTVGAMPLVSTTPTTDVSVR